MLISLCGTPGTGKTTAGSILRAHGLDVVSLNDLIPLLEVPREEDPGSGSWLVDTETLAPALRDWANGIETDTLLEGHLSYLAPSDLCVVLRLDPDSVMTRLLERGYDERKARENGEAEGVGTILSWAVAEEEERRGGADWRDLGPGCGTVVERDVTGLEAAEVAEWILSMAHAFAGRDPVALEAYRPGKVDLLEVLAGWY